MESPVYFPVSLTGSSTVRETAEGGMADSALEDLIHQRTNILAKKLDILGSEMRWRLHIAVENVTGIDREREAVENAILRLTNAALYGWREHRDKGIFYQQLFQLDHRRRAEQVECWRDVVLVMRDFLESWDAHEQAQAKALFLDDVGAGSEGPL